MTTTTASTDRIINRAPKGGCVCPLTHRFFKGGQFIPTATAEEIARLAKPAPLTGSSRQVAWASRIRREELARLDDEIAARLLFLNSPIKAEVRENRKALEGFLIARDRVASERSAARLIEVRTNA